MVNPGQAVQVSVAASGAFQDVLVIGTYPIGASAVLTAPPYQFSVQIPSNTPPDQYWLTAEGVIATGQGASSPSIQILVERQDNPVSLSAQPGVLDFQLAGDQCPLIVVGTFPDGSLVDVTNSSYISYQSDTPAVATVDGDGHVTAVAPGSANITATYAGVSATVPVTVRRVVTIVPAVASLYISQAKQFIAQLNVDPSLAQTVTWSISPQLGTVDQTGLYTAPASLSSWQGVTVTATSVANPAQSASAQIWVFPPVSVSITPAGATLSAAQCQQFTAYVANADASVNWSVSPSGTAPSSVPQTTNSTRTITWLLSERIARRARSPRRRQSR